MVDFKEYYTISLQVLTEYIIIQKQRPNENEWNTFAIKNKYLSSKTIGYICGIGFNKLCRKIIKEVRYKM